MQNTKTIITAAAVALLALGVAKSHAGTVTILKDFYEDRTIQNSSPAIVTFSPVPNGFVLIIRHIYCEIAATGSVQAARLSVTGSTRSLTIPMNTPTSRIPVASADPDMLVYSGKTPVVFVVNGSGALVTTECLLNGKLLPTSSSQFLE